MRIRFSLKTILTLTLVAGAIFALQVGVSRKAQLFAKRINLQDSKTRTLVTNEALFDHEKYSDSIFSDLMESSVADTSLGDLIYFRRRCVVRFYSTNQHLEYWRGYDHFEHLLHIRVGVFGNKLESRIASNTGSDHVVPMLRGLLPEDNP